MPTIYYIVIISEDQGLVRREFLIEVQAKLSQKNIGKLLVNFQTGDYKVSTESYILESMAKTMAKVVVVQEITNEIL